MWTQLERWQNNFDNGMTREKYYMVCEQTGQEPNPDKVPPEIQDFPMDVQKAVTLFNMLGDRIYPDIGYLGKDYTQLETYMGVYEIQNKKMFLEALLRLDAKTREKSAAELKAARDKIRK